MLPFILILLSLGSYCNSAPTGEIRTGKLRTAIMESLELVKRIEKSQFQEYLKTPDNITEEKCILKSLNTFRESLSTNNPTQNTTELDLLLVNLKYIQKELEGKPNLKEHQLACKTIKKNFSNFKDKLRRFLCDLNQNIMKFV